jgi:hypothetical protein
MGNPTGDTSKPDPTADPTTDPDTEPDPQGDPAGDTESVDTKELGDPGKRAIDSMKRERNAARKESQALITKLKEYEDRDKTDTQRLQEALDEAKGRATKAESGALKLQTAIDRAPDGASMTQIRAVAKRLSGDTEEELQSDADELFELLAPATETTKKPLPGKPQERLAGGGDPGEEPDETDPRKLADAIGRH